MGSRLVDARLAETLGVSRQVVRGALARLVEDGLVEQHPWKGSYVRTFGPQDVIDLYNVRLALEPAAARLAARRRHSTADVHALLEAIGEGDFTTRSDAELRFHLALVVASGNEHLIGLYRSVRDRLSIALHLEHVREPGDDQLGGFVPYHRALLEAVDSGDERFAYVVSQEHIVNHVDAVLEALGADPRQLLAPL
jgi:DNA-binding GntR family transcriptional regulator